MAEGGLTKLGTLGNMLRERAGIFTVIKLPDSGRSLVSTRNIPRGTVIHDEFPMLLTPPPRNRGAGEEGSVFCWHCLSGNSQPLDLFCSDSCRTIAEKEWLRVHKMFDFDPFETFCYERREKYPLMAARLLCTLLQQDLGDKAENSVFSSKCGTAIRRANPTVDLKHLCYVNLDSKHGASYLNSKDIIPESWADGHAELMKVVSPLQRQSRNMRQNLDYFNLEWYASVLSRFHINTFRVDNVPLSLDRVSMLKAAAGGLQQQGSAVFLLGSLFNHSCTPNVDVTWPRNNAHAVFVANTDIPKHTELSISYIDQDQPTKARKQILAASYGFNCTCPRCKEDMEDES